MAHCTCDAVTRRYNSQTGRFNRRRRSFLKREKVLKSNANCSGHSAQDPGPNETGLAVQLSIWGALVCTIKNLWHIEHAQ